MSENCGKTLTHVSSLHFLIHFLTPRLAYRRISVTNLLAACGFHNTVELEDAMRTLLRILKNYRNWNIPMVTSSTEPLLAILPNDIPTLRAVPLQFWNLCRQVLDFRLQRPMNLPASVRRLYSWNLNSWHPDIAANAHKTWIIRTLLKTAPVLLQETKWTQVQLQHLAHTWPDIKVAATLAKQDPNPQAGVAILVPPGWIISSQKVLVDHYAVAASVSFQACQIWIVSVYLPPQSPRALVDQIFQAILTLDEHPVFIGGDLNRCDQYHQQAWGDFLGQAGSTDVDPTFPTYRYGHQQGHQQESPLDRFLVPSIFLDTAQLHAQVKGRDRVKTCHHKVITVLLTMKPRLLPHPQSERHQTIPTKVFLDPTGIACGRTEANRQQALRQLRRKISLAQESCPDHTPISVHTRGLVWSWWRSASSLFKQLTPLKKLHKFLGKGLAVMHIGEDDLRQLHEQCGLAELLCDWPKQHHMSLVPTTVVATALQSAEIATATLFSLPFGQEHTDPAGRARRQRLFWDRLKTVCPRGTFNRVYTFFVGER